MQEMTVHTNNRFYMPLTSRMTWRRQRGAGWNCDCSPTPVHCDHDTRSSARPRKCLFKKGGKGDFADVPTADELEDWGGDGLVDEGVNVDAASKRMGRRASGAS
jgi:hypothetical protein